VCGKDWQEANDKAVEYASRNPNATLIHPFEDPLVWYCINLLCFANAN